jgi:hypothetical protein
LKHTQNVGLWYPKGTCWIFGLRLCRMQGWKEKHIRHLSIVGKITCFMVIKEAKAILKKVSHGQILIKAFSTIEFHSSSGHSFRTIMNSQIMGKIGFNCQPVLSKIGL